jgi:hypothetical protein
MTVTALVEAFLTIAFPGWRAIGRRGWCTRQQRRLHALDRRVVWVHDGEKMPWALWGADNGFFEVEWAGRLPYLRAVPALG